MNIFTSADLKDQKTLIDRLYPILEPVIKAHLVSCIERDRTFQGKLTTNLESFLHNLSWLLTEVQASNDWGDLIFTYIGGSTYVAAKEYEFRLPNSVEYLESTTPHELGAKLNLDIPKPEPVNIPPKLVIDAAHSLGYDVALPIAKGTFEVEINTFLLYDALGRDCANAMAEKLGFKVEPDPHSFKYWYLTDPKGAYNAITLITVHNLD